MDKILTNHQIPSSVIDLIEAANDYCFLVTPYYSPWKLLERTLEKASNNEKKIVFIFRAYKVDEQHLNKLNTQLGFDVYLIDRLHTKLYLNEKQVIISSMNLYENSKENNYELGYSMDTMITSRKFLNTVIYGDILGLKPVLHLEGFYSKYKKEEEEKQRNLEQNNKVVDPINKYTANINTNGYCIRCRTKIRLNPSNPLCTDCYLTWRNYSNPDFEENYCHICGRETRSAMNRPLCYECYKKGQFKHQMNMYGY